MAFITAAIAWITANFVPLMAFLTTLVGAGALLAKITPSPKDDRVFAALLRFLNLVPVPSVEPRVGPAPSDDEPPIMG